MKFQVKYGFEVVCVADIRLEDALVGKRELEKNSTMMTKNSLSE